MAMSIGAYGPCEQLFFDFCCDGDRDRTGCDGLGPWCVEAPDADEAQAAAGLVAAGLSGGDPVDPVYGPEEPVPALPSDCPVLAVRAIDRILAPESELATLCRAPPGKQNKYPGPN
jgi:hypothetical protein